MMTMTAVISTTTAMTSAVAAVVVMAKVRTMTLVAMA
jgi:hypothetical protein